MPSVLVDLDALGYKDPVKCIVTGAPGSLHPITLRRMLFLLTYGHGRSVTLPVPLDRPRRLVLWQYLRSLRGLLLLLPLAGVVLMVVARFNRDLPRELASVSAGTIARLASFLVAWLALGVLLNRKEFVRLAGGPVPRGACRLVFPDPEVYERFVRQAESGVLDQSQIVSGTEI